MRFHPMKMIWEGNIRQRDAPPGDVLLMSLLFAGVNTTFGENHQRHEVNECLNLYRNGLARSSTV